jgi:hypothetical protein
MKSIGFVEHPQSASNRQQMISHTFAEALLSLVGISGSNPIVNLRRIDRADVDVRAEIPAARVWSELGIAIAARATRSQRQLPSTAPRPPICRGGEGRRSDDPAGSTGS